jgi:hypothetical protein
MSVKCTSNKVYTGNHNQRMMVRQAEVQMELFDKNKSKVRTYLFHRLKLPQQSCKARDDIRH